jgi:tyrosyl-tRNA synthetase
MGKKESDTLKVSQLFYPCMQCTDVFFLDVDICQLGIDQRKVNMLAIEMADNNRDKPIIVSHGMISGLIEGQEKMSKSNVDSAIFMEDTVEEVKKKIKKAFCPEKIVEANPILDYCKNIIFGARDKLEIIRNEENGGNKYACHNLGFSPAMPNWKLISLKESFIQEISSPQLPALSTS